MDTSRQPTLYKRRYADNEEVSSEDLRTAYQVAAQLVASHGDEYLPLFERLDQEVQQRDEKETIKHRALAVANRGAINTLARNPQNMLE
jgi:hypothetical protein